MKTLIICESYHHGNTKKIADAMAGVMAAEVKNSGEIDAGTPGRYDLIGFGSGIYMGKNHKNLLKLADSLPKLEKKAFIFSTAGGDNENMKDHRALKEKLTGKGFGIVDEFTCRGYDTFGPLFLVGGINKGKPDDMGLENARRFAAKMAGSA
jgi:flavodoxin